MRKKSPMLILKELESTCKCGKEIYLTKRGAEIQAVYLHSKVSIYQCKYKTGWHIGRKHSYRG